MRPERRGIGGFAEVKEEIGVRRVKLVDSQFANCKFCLYLHEYQCQMKKHNGIRPHDIAILLKILVKEESQWLMKELAEELSISPGEVSESLNRSAFAGLLKPNKKEVMKSALLEFMQYGLRYVYPQQPGAIVRGIATAYSAHPLAELITAEEPIVWPYAKGTTRGQALEPLYTGAVEACLKDPKLYELMALADVLRMGKAREKAIAIDELKKRIR